MGDSIMHGVNNKGLKQNVHKHFVSGAKIRTLITDIDMYDLEQFDTIVLYVCGNDMSCNRDIELIEEEYDQLIALIKTRNEKCRIVLTKVAPRGDVDVNPINMIVERLSLHHKTDCADSYRAFYDKNGTLLTHYLNEYDNIHLSRSGTKRLLATIDSSVNIVHDYTKCVFSGQHYQHQFNQSNSPRSRFQSRHRPCMNCNEVSHATNECRHRTPVTCWTCGLKGHKQDGCWNF